MTKHNGHNPASVRINNRKVVLDIIKSSNEITVSQISKKIQLSKTTLWKIIDHFQKQNLIINTGKAKSSDEGGKKPELYRFNSSYAFIISIAIYESYILLALTDAQANIFYKEKVFLDENEKIERIISIIVPFIKKWQDTKHLPLDRAGSMLIGIVIASSGVIDSENGICFTASRFNSWPKEAKIKEMIETQIPLNAQFYIDNYNRYYAFAEKTLGGFEDKKNIVDIVTTNGGLGAGIISQNKIKRGPSFLSGEIGHMCLNPFESKVCHCGGHGCFEQLVSSQVILARAESAKDQHPESIIYRENELDLTMDDIFIAADSDDLFAIEILDDVIKWFAIGILNIALVFNPEVVIISGDYRTAGRYFRNKLKQSVEDLSLIRMNKNIQIEYSKFDEEGALLGGACYVLHDFFNKRFEY